MIRNALTRFIRGREQTRSANGGSAAQRNTVRSPPDARVQGNVARARAESSTSPPTRQAVTPPGPPGPTSQAALTDVSDELIFGALVDRGLGPYPLVFRSIREALLADAMSDEDPGIANKAVNFIRSHLTPTNLETLLEQAAELGADGIVKALQNPYAWSAQAMHQFDNGPMTRMQLRGAIAVPGGVVTISHNGSHPVRFWYPDANTGEWNTSGLRRAHEPDRPSSTRVPLGPWPYQPTVVAALPTGFAIFDIDGGIELFRPPSEGQAIPRPTQVFSATEHREWTAATAVGADRFVATTDAGTVHVFKLVDGQWKESKSLKTGRPLSRIVALGESFAVSGGGNPTITFFDERYKSQKLTCDRSVESLAVLNDGKLLSIDSMGHTHVWSKDGKNWSKALITYKGGLAMAIGDGFVMVNKHSVTTWRKIGDEWKGSEALMTLNGGADHRIMGLCRTKDGFAVIYADGPERMTEIKSQTPWLLDSSENHQTSFFEALLQNNLGLARELLAKGQRPDEQLLAAAAIQGREGVSANIAIAADALVRLAYCEGVEVTDTREHTLIGMALSNARVAEEFEQVAQHIFMGAKLAPVDVTKAIHMASTVGMLPVLAALIQRRELSVRQLPAHIGIDEEQGYSLATAIARLQPVNGAEVTAAGLRYGFFPSIIYEDDDETKLAMENMLQVVPMASLVREFQTSTKQSIEPLLDALMILADDGAVKKLQELIGQGDLTFWSRGEWEDVPFYEETVRLLRQAGMPATVLARYSSIHAPDGWEPPTMTRSADPAERALWLYNAIPLRRGECPFTVKRDNAQSHELALDALDADPQSWQQRWKIKYEGEVGIDAGGLSRAWVSSMLDEMLAPQATWAAFRTGNKFTYFTPDETTLVGTQVHPIHYNTLERFGRLFGRSVKLGMITGIELPPHLLDMLAGRTPELGLKGLAKFDPELARGYQSIIDNPEYIDADQTFSANDTGQRITALRDDIDPATPVTKDNVEAYVEAMATHVLMHRFSGATERFLKGVYDVVDARVFRGFSAEELAQATAGKATFDTTGWRKASAVQVNRGDTQQDIPYEQLQAIVSNNETAYGDAPKRVRLVEWVFQALDALGDEERALLFKAVTTNKRVPGAGFAALPKPFLFKFTKDTEESGGAKEDQPFAGLGLPRAATCDNSFSIPDYPDADTVKAALNAYIEYLPFDPTFNAE